MPGRMTERLAIAAVILAALLTLAACATDRAPAGYKAHCERFPDVPECGGKK